jgi:outer membrane protein TolC
MKKMKNWLALTLFLSLALAQGLTLEEALKKASGLNPVQAALLDEENRKKELERTLADPLRTGLGELQARQAYALAQARRERALKQAERDLVNAYASLLEAELQVRLAQKALLLSQKAERAAEIRLKGGGASPLDLEKARKDRLEAEKNLRLAEAGLWAARKNWQSLTGSEEALPLGDLPLPPEDVEGLLARNPDLLSLRQSLELLDFQLDLLDESFAPRRDIENLKDQRAALAKNLAEAERGLRLGLESGLERLKALLQGVAAAEAAQKAAQAQLEADTKRFKAGLLSEIGLLQSELAALQAELGLLQARTAYLKAYYELLAR